MSYLYMVHDAPEDPPRPMHQKILEEEQAQLYHDYDVLPRCQYIVGIMHVGIDRGIFPYGSEVRQVLDAIMMEAREALMYRRYCRRIEGR